MGDQPLGRKRRGAAPDRGATFLLIEELSLAPYASSERSADRRHTVG
jgi:hypothetical protein